MTLRTTDMQRVIQRPEHTKAVARVLFVLCGALAGGACSAGDGMPAENVHAATSELRCKADALTTLTAVCEDPSTPINAASLGAATAPRVELEKTYGVHLAAAPGGKGGELNFIASRTGLHTIYLGTPNLPLEVHAEGAGTAIGPACVSAIDRDECEPLRRAFAFPLVKGQSYRVVLGPIAPQQWVRLRIEPPNSRGLIVFAAALDGAAHADLYTVEPDGSGLTRLTDTPLQDEQFPRWSPDFTRVAYLRDGALVVATHTGKDAHVVTTTVGRSGAGITAPAWSPDGTRLVYSYPRPPFVIEDTDESYRTSLHVVREDGTGDTAIPEPSHAFPPGIGTLTEPAWSPTGIIAFLQADDCPDCAGGASFATINEDGSGYSQILVDTFERPAHDVDWSPTGTLWAYTQLNPRDGRIAVSAPDGSGARTLTEVSSKMPRWSPDASRIAYVAPDGIYVLKLNAGLPAVRVAAATVRGVDW